MKKLWFKNKTYGWGWVPASKEGWGITVLFIILLGGSSLLYERYISQNPADTALLTSCFFLWQLLLAGGLIFICYKTGEKPRWRWGK